MAKKDTYNALIARDISEAVAEKLIAVYSTLKSITEAGVDGLVKDAGLTQEEAEDASAKVVKRAPRTTTKAKKAEDVEIIKMDLISNKHHEITDEEDRLLKMSEELGIDLPLKVIVDISKRIKGHDFSDEICTKLLTVANRMYCSHMMDSHESAGVMAAHSLGEPGTQMNMRTFHFSGVANILTTQGLPRLIEIVDARRIPSTPSMEIPLVGLAAEDESVARLVSYNIETTSLLNVATVETDITNMRMIIRPDQRNMDDRGVTREDIVERLNKVKVLRGLVEASEFEITVTSDEPSFKKLQVISDAVKNAKIKGIDGISRAVLTKNKFDDRWTIITEGSNLKEVLKVEGVNVEKIKTNSILEVADVLGIEAARNSIINEAYGTLSEAGLNVDIRHIMLVADLMTNDGYVKAIGRHGISGRKSSVLARAAFEITAPHLLHAAMNGEVDHLEGVAENIIVGQPVTLGTGAVNLIYTPKKGDEE